MLGLRRAALAASLFFLVGGCCTAPKIAMDALAESWDDAESPETSIKGYAVAGVEADPALVDHASLPEEEREARRLAKARRLRVIDEFGITLKEAQANAK